jgi:lipoic acid synthetase
MGLLHAVITSVDRDDHPDLGSRAFLGVIRSIRTKSGLMTGLGESKEELLDAFATLREHDVQVLTVGQYLRPTKDHLPVVRYWHPNEFAELERDAYAMGFESVAAGPLVRSSYHAEQTLEQAAAR